MFTKLLVIRIVTNNVLGFWRISKTNCSFLFDDDSKSLISLGWREKNAVSLEDAIAEHSNSTHIIIKHIIALTEIPTKKGSIVVIDNRHIRGSSEDNSKIIYFIVTGAKIIKKGLKTKDQGAKFLI